MESQLHDVNEAKKAWHALVKYLKDPRRVAGSAEASSPEKPTANRHPAKFPFLRIEGDEIHPALAGFFLHLSPHAENVLSDRFLDIDASGERTHADRELQVPLNMPKDVIDAWDAAESPEQLGDIVATWASTPVDKVGSYNRMLMPSNYADRMPALFMHEFLHALQAERSGPEATLRSFKGPEHPTTQRRLDARLKKKDIEPDASMSIQSSESYAMMDRLLLDAENILQHEPNISLQDFLRVTLQLTYQPKLNPKKKRIIRMLSKMWHDAKNA